MSAPGAGEVVFVVRARLDDPSARDGFAKWLVEEHADALLDAGALAWEVTCPDDPASRDLCEARYRFASAADFLRYEAEHATPLREASRAALARLGPGATFERTVVPVVGRRAR